MNNYDSYSHTHCMKVAIRLKLKDVLENFALQRFTLLQCTRLPTIFADPGQT